MVCCTASMLWHLDYMSELFLVDTADINCIVYDSFENQDQSVDSDIMTTYQKFIILIFDINECAMTQFFISKIEEKTKSVKLF